MCVDGTDVSGTHTTVFYGVAHAPGGVRPGRLRHHHVETIRTSPEPDDLGAYASPTRQRLVQRLEHDDPCTATDHEPVAGDVIRARCLLRPLVEFRSEREAKGLKTGGDQRVHLFSAPRDRAVHDAGADELVCRADTMRRGGTRGTDGITASVDLEQIRDRRARGAGHAFQHDERADLRDLSGMDLPPSRV